MRCGIGEDDERSVMRDRGERSWGVLYLGEIRDGQDLFFNNVDRIWKLFFGELCGWRTLNQGQCFEAVLSSSHCWLMKGLLNDLPWLPLKEYLARGSSSE